MGRILVEDQYFDIANIDHYDIIVGTAFMYECHVILDVHQCAIHISEGKGKTLGTLSPGEEMEVLHLCTTRREVPGQGSPKC